MTTLFGLGNPGKTYEQTRHNIGFVFVERLAAQMGATWNTRDEVVWTATGEWNGHPLLLVKPQTFMNASGEAFQRLSTKKGVKKEEVIVVYDDADLAFGVTRWKEDGRSGGHRGMQSLIDVTGTEALRRLKLGIGRSPNPLVPLEAYVLEKWTSEESKALPAFLDAGLEVLLVHL